MHDVPFDKGSFTEFALDSPCKQAVGRRTNDVAPYDVVPRTGRYHANNIYPKDATHRVALNQVAVRRVRSLKNECHANTAGGGESTEVIRLQIEIEKLVMVYVSPAVNAIIPDCSPDCRGRE